MTATIDERFREFHKQHPEVMRELLELCDEALAAGRTRIGMKQLFEVVRWHRIINPHPKGDFKLNNSYTSRYARLIMRRLKYRGLFETRTLKAA